jgi:hypothetical protein
MKNPIRDQILVLLAFVALALPVSHSAVAEDSVDENRQVPVTALSGQIITVDPDTGERIHDPEASQRLSDQAARTLGRFHRRLDEIRYIELDDGSVVMDSARSFANFSAARVSDDGQVQQTCLSGVHALPSFIAGNHPDARGDAQ